MLPLGRPATVLSSPSSLRPLFLAFILVISFAAADDNANPIAMANNTCTAADNANPTGMANNTCTAAMDVKARFLCTYDNGITRVITIDKNIDGFHALQADIAAFFPGKPTGFTIKYVLPDHPAQSERRYVDVITDEDARNLMVEYQAVARASPNTVRIDLYVMLPHWYDSDWVQLVMPLICLTVMGSTPVIAAILLT